MKTFKPILTLALILVIMMVFLPGDAFSDQKRHGVYNKSTSLSSGYWHRFPHYRYDVYKGKQTKGPDLRHVGPRWTVNHAGVLVKRERYERKKIRYHNRYKPYPVYRYKFRERCD